MGYWRDSRTDKSPAVQRSGAPDHEVAGKSVRDGSEVAANHERAHPLSDEVLLGRLPALRARGARRPASAFHIDVIHQPRPEEPTEGQ